MLLKKEYDTDEDEESDCNAGDSDTDEEQVLDPNSEAYQRLPTAVRNRLQELSGRLESLHDENQKLKEVCCVCYSLACSIVFKNASMVALCHVFLAKHWLSISCVSQWLCLQM